MIKKLLIAVISLCSLNVTLMFAQHYNVSNYQASGTVNINGKVNEVPLTIYPIDAEYYGIFDLGTVNPGGRIEHPYADDGNPEFGTLTGWMKFNVNGANGYNVRIIASFDKEIDGLRIEPIWKIGPTPIWTNSYNIIVPNSGEPWTQDYEITSANGFYIMGDIQYMEALPGAPAGKRTFTFTMNCEYYEIGP